MQIWLKRTMIGLAIAVFQFLLLWYFKFSFWAIIFLFLLLGGLVYLLEHRNFAWALLIGTVVFGLGMSLFGWTIMPGWVKPEDYFAK